MSANKKIQLLFLFLCTSFLLQGQNCYEEFLGRGQRYLKQQRYSEAEAQFRAAAICDDCTGARIAFIENKRNEAIDKRINQLQTALTTAEEERRRAEAAQRKAEQEQARAEREEARQVVLTKEAERGRRAAELTAQAIDISKDDLTLGVRLADEACLLSENKSLLPIKTRRDILSNPENNFYNNSLTGHDSYVKDAVYSPFGKYIATAGGDKTAKLWTTDGQLVSTFEGHMDQVSCLAFSPDEKLLVTGSYDGTAKLWTLDGKLIRTLDCYGDLYDVAFSPDGGCLLTAGGNQIFSTLGTAARLWDLEGNILKAFHGHRSIVSAATFSPDGQHILTGSWDKTIRLWKSDGELIESFETHTGEIAELNYSADGQYILSGSWDKTAQLIHLETKAIRRFIGHSAPVNTARFSPDGQYLLTGSSDRQAFLWTLDGRLLKTFKGHTGAITAVDFSKSGDTILTASGDATARLWPIHQNTTLAIPFDSTTINHRYTTAQFSADGNTLLVAGGVVIKGTKHSALLLDLKGNVLQTFDGHTSYVSCAAFSPFGKYIVSGSNDKTAKLWDVEGKEVVSFVGHTGAVRGIAFSPDGQNVFTRSADRTGRLWTLEGEEILKIEGLGNFDYDCAFSPDGQYLIMAGPKRKLLLYNQKGSLIQKMEGHGGGVSALGFSKDGKYILTGSHDYSAMLWAVDGQQITQYHGHDSKITAVQFLSDDRYIMTASHDKQVKIWDRETGEEFMNFRFDHGINVLLQHPHNPHLLFAANGSHESYLLQNKLTWLNEKSYVQPLSIAQRLAFDLPVEENCLASNSKNEKLTCLEYFAKQYDKNPSQKALSTVHQLMHQLFAVENKQDVEELLDRQYELRVYAASTAGKKRKWLKSLFTERKKNIAVLLKNAKAKQTSLEE